MALDEEILKVRERLHKLSDQVQVHEGKILGHDIKIEFAAQQVQALIAQTATREQLDTATLSLGEKLAASVALMTLQIQTIADDIAPLRKGIYWIVTLVLGAVVLAVLTLVLRQP